MSRMLESYSDDIIIYNAENKISKYLSRLNTIKEFVINAWDADAYKVKISVDSNEVIIEDWGFGIDNFRLFWSIGNDHKSLENLTSRFRRKPIGCRGLGKLSYVSIGNKILVITSTKDRVESSFVDYKNMKFYVSPSNIKNNKLSHTGTKIIITGLKKPLDKDLIINYIKEELYGLILPIASKNTLEVFVNNEKVIPEIPVFKEEKVFNRFGEINFSLFSASVSKIDILYRGIKITQLDPKDNLNAIGYINVDWPDFVSLENKIANTEEANKLVLEIKKIIKNKILLELEK